MYQHSTFSPGQPPASLVPKKQVCYQGSESYKKARRGLSAQKAEYLEMLYLVEVQGKKIIPAGVCVMVKKQITVPVGQRWTGKTASG